MMNLIVRGLSVSPGPYTRMPVMNDATSQHRFVLRYAKIGARTFRVYRGIYPDQQLLGVVLSWYGSQCWAFIPEKRGLCDQWYLAPTRFEAVNACFRFYMPVSE